LEHDLEHECRHIDLEHEYQHIDLEHECRHIDLEHEYLEVPLLDEVHTQMEQWYNGDFDSCENLDHHEGFDSYEDFDSYENLDLHEGFDFYEDFDFYGNLDLHGGFGFYEDFDSYGNLDLHEGSDFFCHVVCDESHRGQKASKSMTLSEDAYAVCAQVNDHDPSSRKRRFFYASVHHG
jgi:hypothetical protein